MTNNKRNLWHPAVSRETWSEVSGNKHFLPKIYEYKCRPETIQTSDSILVIHKKVSKIISTDRPIIKYLIYALFASIELWQAQYIVFQWNIQHVACSNFMNDWMTAVWLWRCSSRPSDAEESRDERRKVGVVITHRECRMHQLCFVPIM